MSHFDHSDNPTAKSRFSQLIAIVVSIAILAAMFVAWRVWVIREFGRLRDEGTQLISTFELQRPSTISQKRWITAVETVETAWANTVFSPNDVSIRDVRAMLRRIEILIRDQGHPPRDKLVTLLNYFAELRPNKRLYIEGQHMQLQSVLNDP